jgi:hypothetical protein
VQQVDEEFLMRNNLDMDGPLYKVILHTLCSYIIYKHRAQPNTHYYETFMLSLCRLYTHTCCCVTSFAFVSFSLLSFHFVCFRFTLFAFVSLILLSLQAVHWKYSNLRPANGGKVCPFAAPDWWVIIIMWLYYHRRNRRETDKKETENKPTKDSCPHNLRLSLYICRL